MKFFSAKSLVVLVGLASLTQSASAQGIFPDKNLETAVRREVFEKRMNDMPILEADVPNISQVVGKGKDGKKVTNLSGMEKCRSVALIDLEDNEIVDLSAIKDLKMVQSLTLRKNKIKDLSPLAGLTNLQYLQLENNEVEDLAPLAGLTNMRSLYLSNNKIKNIEPLSKLTKLWSLYLGGNQISDIKPLAGLKGLDTINLAGNGLTDIGPVAELTPSKFLFLENNKLKDISLLVTMAKKDAEGSKRFAPFWYVDLSGNPIPDAAKNAQLSELRKYSVGSRIIFK